ncbi:uncharacterized protein LOC108698338 [Xenopus laevis]|uniref:Uncharacterized protein n=2 Tax=Xenopus laevis TaxID=8355 RepID=A0A974H742_XENLA|nr:uncharacterized protein LOC108698338 [Xenopus laevis]OCT67384.1 hypothetical protein XELAEV_18038679mg [Xenopus laevis]
MADVVETSPQPSLFAPTEAIPDETPELVSCIFKQVTSTPFTFTGRANCELTPINNMKSKCNFLESKRSQDLQHMESPMQYRSFFLAECEEIARQLQSKEPEECNRSKRKIEALDISTIEAEPPPFLCTPKSTLDDTKSSAKKRRLDLLEYSSKGKFNHYVPYCESPIPICLLSKSKESIPVTWMGNDQYKPNESPLLKETLDTNQAYPKLTTNERKNMPLISIKELEFESSNKCITLDGEDIQFKNSCYFAYRTQQTLLQTPEIKTYGAARCEGITIGLNSKHTGRQKKDMVGKDRHPIPYDRSPLKVKIAFELTKTFSPLEGRNVKEGPSILGVSLLDLEKMNMEEHDGTCKKDTSVSKDGVSESDVLLNTTVSIEKQEQQRPEEKRAASNIKFIEKSHMLNKPFERNKNIMNENPNLKMCAILNNTVTFTDHLGMDTSSSKTLSISHNKLRSLNSCAVDIRPNVIQFMPASLCGNTTKNIMDTKATKENVAAHDTVLIDDGRAAKVQFSTVVSINTTQDIVPMQNKIAPNNSAQGMKKWTTGSKIALNTTHDIVLKHPVITTSNGFQENISSFNNAPAGNAAKTTQSTCNDIDAANATQDIISNHCKVSKSSPSQGIVSVHDGTNALNITRDVVTSHNVFHQPTLTFGMETGRTKPSVLSKLRTARSKAAVRHKRPKEMKSNGYTMAGRIVLPKNGVYASSSKELINDTEPVEHCRTIKEPEIIQDESIFFDGSSPLITSTPMPGLCNHRFIKKSFEDSKKDNTKLPSSVLGVQKSTLVDNSENKPVLINIGLQGRTASHCSLVPRFSKNSILPKSVKAFRKPQPPSNSLAISAQAPVIASKVERSPEKQVSTQKEIVVSSKKLIQNVPETSKVDAPPSQTTESCFRTPSIAAAKTSGIKMSKLPLGSSLVKPSSRLCPPSSGKFSFGASSSSTALQKAAFGFRISDRPTASTGIPIRNHGLVSNGVGRGVE